GADFRIVARLHRAHHGDVSRARIYHQQVRFIGSERQRIRTAADLHGANDAAFIDGIDADVVGTKVALVQQTVVRGHDAAHRTIADEVGAAHLIRARFNNGEAVSVEVADKQ